MLTRTAAALAATLIVAVGCSLTQEPAAAPPADDSSHPAPAEMPPPLVQPAPATPAETDPVAELVQGMSDEELAGQLLLVAVYGGDAQQVSQAHAAANRALYGVDTPGEVVETLQPGGVIFIGRNPQDPQRPRLATDNTTDAARVPTLIAGLQAEATVPLLVAIDQEHGPVVRLGDPFTHFPSAMALAATDDAALVRRVAGAAAEELAKVGINVNLAPVADINTEPSNPVIGIRSLGEQPAPAGELLAAQIAGIQNDAGIAATAKHYPGHGDTTVDSHDALPTVDDTLPALQDGPLIPFEAAIAADVSLIMPGHLLLPAVDPSHPATLSSALLGGLLREQMGFDGVIVTDSMWMGAIRSADDPATAVAALAAGVDLLLMPPDGPGTRDAIVEALDDGTLQRQDVRESVTRLLRLKQHLGLLEPRGADLPDPELPASDLLARHDDLAVDAAARAVTLLDGDCPPALDNGTTVSVTGDGAEHVRTLMEEAGVTTGPEGDVRLLLWDGQGAPLGAGDAIIAVTGSPYATGQVNSYASLLVTYGDTDSSLRGLVAALKTGRLSGATPVSIPRSDTGPIPVGQGLICP